MEFKKKGDSFRERYAINAFCWVFDGKQQNNKSKEVILVIFGDTTNTAKVETTVNHNSAATNAATETDRTNLSKDKKKLTILWVVCARRAKPSGGVKPFLDRVNSNL